MDNDYRHKLYLLIHSAQTLKDAIHAAKHAESTISEHWGTLVKYGRLVHTVLEFGAGFSTLAWLASAGHVTSYDVETLPWMDRLQDMAEGRLTHAVADDLAIEPREVDLLYIDTLHTYAQLSAELARHGRHARLIVLHDVESFRDENAPLTRQYCPGDLGLMPAIREFCAASGYKVLEHKYNQHGLLILERP